MSGFDDHETELSDDPSARAAIRRRLRLAWRDASGDRWIVVDRMLLVGSVNRADVVLEDKAVSRLHAELEPRVDGVWIKDLGSKNGTLVDGVFVKEARLRIGNHVRVGSTTLVVSDAVEESVELWPAPQFGPLVGASVAMRETFALLARIAERDTTVLLTGETGTGKEVAARALHEASPRANGPFVIVDCGALPQELLESELFGHTKGAFTGAISAREGAFDAANGGTLFLDEIGELPLAVQPKLLRALESKTIRRVGESQHRPIDVRFVCGTHRDLGSMVNAGTFREDLYFRLAVLPIHLPPLRERMDDIALLVDHFQPHQTPEFRIGVLREALTRTWPGNIRELRNFLERAAALGTERAAAMSPHSSHSLPPPPLATPSIGGDLGMLAGSFDKPFRDFKDDVEREYVKRLVLKHGGNAAAAAQAAGVDRTYIYRLLKKHEG